MNVRLFHLIALMALLLASAGPVPVHAQDGIPPEPVPEMTALTPLKGQVIENAAQVAVGTNHACVLNSYGGVLCWGSNASGQLGVDNVATPQTSIPVPVTNLSKGVIAITAGGSHTCALLDTGAVKCWGENSSGQLGDGSGSNQMIPVLVANVANAVWIAAGNAFTCAVTDSGKSVKCWGNNTKGQLGDGTTTNQFTPVRVNGLADVAEVTAGSLHTCALLPSGSVKCWGYNIFGQLGNNSNQDSKIPVDVYKLADPAISLRAGDFHTCALFKSGAMQCWGRNADGPLGDGTTTDRWFPTTVQNLGGLVLSIDAGGNHTCAVLTSGALQCWGQNTYGQLGNGTKTRSLYPVSVSGQGTAAQAVGAGTNNTCAVLSNGTLQCWGDNTYGQLGNGYHSSNPMPFQVPDIKSEWTAAGENAACAVTTDGAAYCWGTNTDGQLGDGTNTDHFAPTPVKGLSSGVQDIQYGVKHACALLTSGGVKCWGANNYGQLGNNSTVSSNAPVNVAGIGLTVKALAIAAGSYHTCALTDDAAAPVKCWGLNASGQLGNNSNTNQLVPVNTLPLQGPVLELAAGGNHTCAAVDNKDVPLQCWGSNSLGELGNGLRTNSWVPVAVIKLGVPVLVSAIATGYNHTCAVMDTGAVKCWGNNANGQLGDNTDLGSLEPVNVIGLPSTASDISAGNMHTCAILQDGSLYCWGSNSLGQLGSGDTAEKWTPSAVLRLDAGVTQVSAGAYSTCAARAGGDIFCWGRNQTGQMGMGSASISVYPSYVFAPLKLNSISPSSGMNNTPVRVTLYGTGFQNSTMARLEPSNTELEDVVVLDGNTLQGTVPPGLIGGYYNAAVYTPSQNSSVRSSAYLAVDPASIDDLYAYPLDIVVESRSVYPGSPVNVYIYLRRLTGKINTTSTIAVDFSEVLPSGQIIPIGRGFVNGIPPGKGGRSSSVVWRPSQSGIVKLHVSINTTNNWIESDYSNNEVERDVKVLPLGADTISPTVDSVTVAGGNQFSASRSVTITSRASDPGGSGVSRLLFIEYAFNQALSSWEVVQITPWQFYAVTSTNYLWTLDPTPGAHYIQVWAADRAGNISLRSKTALINYLPPKDVLSYKTIRIFRHTLKAGQTFILTLYTSRFGSADLYVWNPSDWTTLYQAKTGFENPKTIIVYSEKGGTFQYEVEGTSRFYTTYSLTVMEDAKGILAEAEPGMLARGSAGSNMVPDDLDTGVPSADLTETVFLPALAR